MTDLIQNLIHDSKSVGEIFLYEFGNCQFSNNTYKCELCFMKDFLHNVRHNKKGFDANILFEFIIYHCSNDT